MTDTMHYGGLTFARERVGVILAERELMEGHACEVFPYRHISVDRRQYALLERCDAIRAFTARTDDRHSRIVGYASYLIAPSLHERGKFRAGADTVYLHPDYRSRGGVGMRFIQYSVSRLFDEGIDEVLQSVPSGQGWDRVLTAAGFEPLERTYIRRK